MSTRADPDLPLARLRARRELVEIRARDLRFTVAETQAYLVDVGGLAVSTDDVTTLESRTEGWAAALQLAALSLRDRDDVTGFIAGFAGTDRHVLDYLVDEVLSGQPDGLRRFLTATAVLDPLCASLCDAALERTGSQAVLEALERANLFLVPLDDVRRWYRYHHLFGDVLESHLRHESPELVAGLHARASRWYDGEGDAVSAVRHALAAGEVDRAAALAEAALPALQRGRQEAVIRSWIGELPDDVVRARPVLAVGFVGALMSSNDFAAVPERLAAVAAQLPAIEALLADAGTGDVAQDHGIVAVDGDELARVPSAVELYTAGMSLVSGDLAGTHQHAQRAIEIATPGDDLVRAAASGLSGLAHWACGELDDAHRRYTDCIDGLIRVGHVADALGCSLTLADIRMAQGRLRDAQASFDDGLRLASTAEGAPRGVADLQVGLAQVALDRGLLDEARDLLEVARRLGEARGLPQHPYRSRAAAAMLAAADGDLEGALTLVADAQRVYLGDFSPDVRPLHAVAARILVRRGDVDAALLWAQEHAVTSAQELSYLREFEHVTLAEILLAQHRRDRGASDGTLDEATDLLDRLRAAAYVGGRTATVIDVVVLQALLADARGEADGAVASLDEAVRLAQPEGQVAPFTRHGGLLVPLLEKLATRIEKSDWTTAVVDACRAASVERPHERSVTSAAAAPVVDPLSARELEVLRLLDTELDGPEIAQHLFVSLNTVRTHTKSIYTKLGVNNRRAAVRRGRELGLLATW